MENFNVSCVVRSLVDNPKFDSTLPVSQSNMEKIVDDNTFVVNSSVLSRFINDNLGPDVLILISPAPAYIG